MAQNPFVWTGNTGQISTPQQANDARAIAAALANGRSKVASNGWEGLAQLTNAWAERGWRDQAAEAEEAGIASAAEALAGITPQSGFSDIAAALSNPWLSQPQSTIAAALLQQNLDRQDPMYQLQRQKLEQEIAMMGQPQPVDPTSAMQNYEYLVGIGTDPAEAQGLAFGGNGTTINNMGNIPAGYEVVQDPNTGATRMQPIPGSPAALEAEAAATRQASQGSGRDIVTDTIVSGAQSVRDAAQGFAATGFGNAVTGGMGFTPAGNLNEYVKSLKAIAASENINAMRQASPTGGALGNTSDADLRLLENKAGALNPQSPDFLRQVDDYERTLLRIVHGYEAGDAIFEQTRPQNQQQTQTDVDSILQQYGL